MAKIKTSEAIDAALDWAVTMLEKPEACEYGVEDWRGQRRQTVKNGEYVYRWHQSWAQGGPIIDRMADGDGFRLEQRPGTYPLAEFYYDQMRGEYRFSASGPTPLIAAMRCYVASKLGDELDVPDELLPESVTQKRPKP